MTGILSVWDDSTRTPDIAAARKSFSQLMTHVARLHGMGGSSSLSAFEAQELTASAAHVLGITDKTAEEAAHVLAASDPIALWHAGLAALDARVDAALDVLHEIMATMPPIRNVSLRDTLASLSQLKHVYDMRFAAHEVPCDIDYQLSEPIDTHLMGLDYIEAWLTQLLKEARWLAQFDVESCVSVLDRVCPDYRGLHVNLYDLLLPYEGELKPAQ